MTTGMFSSGAIGIMLAAPFAMGQVIADSAEDWNTAINDGIGVGGASVVAGSPEDAAQQEHADSTGSGTWSYRFGNSGDGQAFSGGFPTITDWVNGAWRFGSGTIGATFQSPGGSSINADPMIYRRWTSNGANTGQTLTAEVTVESTSAASDGITLVFNVLGAGNASITRLITPAEVNQPLTFTLDFEDFAGQAVLAGIRPEGTGPNNGSNFFNDAARVQLRILPSPGAAALLAGGLLVTGRRRQS
ncbi:MAG: hypothetical protein AAGB51_07505 [Planctomycetota bacterium]